MGAYLLLALMSLTLFVHNLAAEEIFHVSLPPNIKDTSEPLCSKCHPVLFKDAKGSLAQEIKHNSEEPDALSLACINCHDGNTANEAPISLSNSHSSAENRCYTIIKNHPVLLKYPNGKKDLRSLWESLPGKWIGATVINDLLRDGKIVCVSCHIPHHTRKTGYLRTLNKDSSLCFGCHKK
ncbi:MAG: cytochrome c3 family protein [Sulfurimonas sp.]|nr:cytochrome c3 family protein [Sulfurimonas sp.]